MNPFNTTVTMHHSVRGAEGLTSHHLNLSHWLQATIDPKTDMALRARDRVLQIRRETDEARQKELKKYLPGVAVGCKIRKGEPRQHENIESLTGWMQFDIDPDGNPEISDWPELRDKLAQLVYVAFAGLSVRGRGVWGLVKIKHPDKLAEHFQQFIFDVLGRLGIVLDPTKGGNPTDLRFYSYDPDAILKTQFKIYDRLPEYRTRKVVRRKTKPNQTDVFTFAENYARKHSPRPGDIRHAGKGDNSNNRHYFLYAFCCALNRKGVPQHEAEQYINANIIPLDQVKSNCIVYPYRHYKTEFGTWQDMQTEPIGRRQTPNPTRELIDTSTGEVFEYPPDWDEVPEPDEGTAEYNEMIRLIESEFDAVIDHSVSPEEIEASWIARDNQTPVKAWND